MKHTHYSYCVFYIEEKYYKDINKDLKDNGYKHVRAIVPTIKFIDHQSSRGRYIDTEVPILFNYGFMKVPTNKVFDRQYMVRMKKNIPGIRGWLKNTETLHRGRGKRPRVDNLDIFDDFSQIARVSRVEVRRFLAITRENSRLKFDDITALHIGDFITLRHYPYIGVDAIVQEVDWKNQRVKLLTYPETYKIFSWLPIELVIYSVYEDFDPRKLLSDQQKGDLSRVTNDQVTKIPSKRHLKTKKLNYQK